MDTKILLENGTNELEILEFTLAGNSYGINVAKIKEIITYQPVTPVPNSHPSIEGIFMPRDTMITAIDLKNCLGRGESEKKGLFIVTNFNKLDIAFHVESVLGIHRVSWRDIIKPDITISAADESVATGIIKKNDKLIIILDFEKIVSDINPETGLKMSELNELGERTRSSVPILIAEDSPLLNKLIVDSLKAAGYVNLIHTENGQKAYDVITQCKEDGTLDQHVRCIITDIEMPEMDGHRLTKLVKSDDATKDIPIIIFSSLVNDDMKRKGEALGADAQISKHDKQTEEILQKIEEAEYVLVGLGQEFDMEFFLQSREDYRRIREQLQQQNVLWLLPYVEEQFRRQYLPEMEAEIEKGLQKLAKVLEKKSYFVVSSSLNHKLAEVPWKKMLLKKERFVAPCGDWTKKQCPDGCEEGIQTVTEADEEQLQESFKKLQTNGFSVPDLGKCPKCGKKLVLNNVYAGRYDEKGYLKTWTEYQNWLQNTLNHKMVLLEIGEGNRFPTIIRFPFERIALFQQKADLYCIDGEQNPIAWLLSLC